MCLFSLLADDIHLKENYMYCMDLIKICNVTDIIIENIKLNKERKYGKLVLSQLNFVGNWNCSHTNCGGFAHVLVIQNYGLKMMETDFDEQRPRNA